MPDHTLNEEDLKEKRRQRLMKAGYDARIRAKAERDAEKLRVAEEKEKDEEARRTDPAGWLEAVRRQHEVRFRSFWRGENARISDVWWFCSGRCDEDQGPEEEQGAAIGSQEFGGAEPHEVDRELGERGQGRQEAEAR